MKIVDNLLATADKVDYGVLSFAVVKKDKDSLKHILQQGFTRVEPNMSHWIYKNRAGMKNIVVWTNLDLGTMREEVLFTTDYDYNLMEVSGTEIEFELIDTSIEKRDKVDETEVEYVAKPEVEISF